MAKITDRQKNNIIAKWNTGSYTKTQLAKTYKTSESNIRKIVGTEKPTNADVVEAQTNLENWKKCEKSAIEIKAINQAVKYELDSKEYKSKNVENVHNTANQVLMGISKLLEKGTYKKPIKVKNGDYDVIEHVEHDLTSGDFNNCANGVDKVSVTLGVNERFSSSQTHISNNNAQQTNETNNNLTVEFK